MGWLKVLLELIVSFLKGIFGTDKPEKTTVDHPKPDVKVDDGKTDEERLKDLHL